MLQPACHRSVVRFASAKIADCLLARKKAKANREPPEAADFCPLTEEQSAEDIEQFSDVFEDSDDKMTIVVGKKPCNVSVTNCDLPAIVNGRPTDPTELRPFNFCFQK